MRDVRRGSSLAQRRDARRHDDESEPGGRELLRGVPGFVAYYAVRHGAELTTITACDTRAGTQESTRLAGEWVKQNVSGSPPGAPEITEGETFLQFAR